LIDYLSSQLNKAGVAVELNKEATPELVRQAGPDVVILATGSDPITLDVPGVDKANVATALDVLLGQKEVGKSVIIAGGGLVGCETALYLAQKGKKVTIVEILDSVMKDVFIAIRVHMLALLEEAKVEILTGSKILEITDTGTVTADKNGDKKNLEAASIVLALGLKSKENLASALKDRAPEVYTVGDCVKPRLVINAIWTGSIPLDASSRM
jgi:2-enoate reductase